MGDNESAGFEFFSNFDSGNLAKIEYVPPNESVVPVHTARGVVVEVPDVEFNIWTKPDCDGTEFQNANRTWFYFGIRANSPGFMVKINMVDINRQAKMYSQGMAPVFRTMPGKPNWERVRDRPTHAIVDDIFILSFKFKTPENTESITYFAFTYPYTYTDLTCTLGDIDKRFLKTDVSSRDDIYYTREAVCFTLDGRRVELLTISSHHYITPEREVRLKNLFPEERVNRPFKFVGKKIIFVSSRVHPGETPASFVFNGLLELLLNRENPTAIMLRKLYVFKLIPMLNPDGVANGHYRTDTRGVNLNRVYLNPVFELHPSIYAARALVRYYHYGIEKEDEPIESIEDIGNGDDDDGSSVDDNPHDLSQKVSNLSLGNKKNKAEVWCCKCKTNINKLEDTMPGISNIIPSFNHRNPFSVGKSMCHNCGVDCNKNPTKSGDENKCEHGDSSTIESGLFLYIDMHGHASKKGIFMYGNHFEDLERNVECMLLPKIMSLNNHNFHFTACNFTERNMYMKDRRDGMSKEGCGRVAVLKLTGLIRSYTLECNYNTGRLVNVLPTPIKHVNLKSCQSHHVPPKYTPQTYEEVGKALGSSILDLTGQNPATRLPNSQFHTLGGLREWLQIHCMNELGETGFTSAKYKLRNTNKRAQAKNVRGILIKARSALTKGPKKTVTKTLRNASVPIDRKENVYGGGDVATKPVISKPKSIVKPRPKSFHNLGTKVKQEVTLKAKGNTTNEKSKSTAILRGALSAFPSNRPKLKIDLNTKLKTIKEQPRGKSPENNEPEASSIKLQEICYIKDGEGGKRMIAKYKKKDGLEKDDADEDLIVAWDMHNNTQVYADKQSDAGCSSKAGYRVHNYGKSSSTKFKRNKRLTRRFSGVASVLGNPERLKKQKFVKNKFS